MNRPVLLFAASIAAITLGGCGRPFDVKTAPGFVELDNQQPQYDYRAVSPEGVVVAVRAIPLDEKGDLAFWERAITLRMRQMSGYALLRSADVKSRDGTPGRELRFGHDEDGKPYLYNVRMFVAQDRLFLVESGGPAEQVDRYAKSLDWMEQSVRVKCDTFVSPVLASKTCNRW